MAVVTGGMMDGDRPALQTQNGPPLNIPPVEAVAVAAVTPPLRLPQATSRNRIQSGSGRSDDVDSLVYSNVSSTTNKRDYNDNSSRCASLYSRTPTDSIRAHNQPSSPDSRYTKPDGFVMANSLNQEDANDSEDGEDDGGTAKCRSMSSSSPRRTIKCNCVLM
ncbi:hypothetical protein FOL47_001277 [Perkinsus chesapeaki]|uniref:Uncharacterized protein n=1 Tax=Perkinsus chesapeaki TaxID=330153 RepID=A0A7J6N0Q1_PERCH|nr:hypothetical protein FOL47_001277 [Perkinsus chesapeaki]